MVPNGKANYLLQGCKKIMIKFSHHNFYFIGGARLVAASRNSSTCMWSEPWIFSADVGI